jgi:hypothetical protein
MTSELAIKIIKIDAQIELLQSGDWNCIKGNIEKKIEKLKQQKIQLYENTCNRL